MDGCMDGVCIDAISAIKKKKGVIALCRSDVVVAPALFPFFIDSSSAGSSSWIRDQSGYRVYPGNTGCVPWMKWRSDVGHHAYTFIHSITSSVELGNASGSMFYVRTGQYHPPHHHALKNEFVFLSCS